MSVICHNFVQNAWKKDLCSNCFKSSAEHMHTETRNDEILNFINSGVTSPLTGSNGEMLGRYMSQATTIYQSRNLLHSQSRAWPSLIIDQKVKSHKLNMSMKLPATCMTEPTVEITEVNGFNLAIKDSGCQESKPVTAEKSDAGVEKIKHKEDVIPDNKVTEDDEVQGIMKYDRKEERFSVKFFEEEAMVIGFGGHDYDPNEPEWELASDDGGEVVFELMDDTVEERIITRMTKENTEFNSDNSNLLKDPTQAEEVHVMNVKNAISKLEGLNLKSNVATDDKTSDVGSNKTKSIVPKPVPANSKSDTHDVIKSKDNVFRNETKPVAGVATKERVIGDTENKPPDKRNEAIDKKLAKDSKACGTLFSLNEGSENNPLPKKKVDSAKESKAEEKDNIEISEKRDDVDTFEDTCKQNSSSESPLYSFVTKPSKLVNEAGQKCTCPDISNQVQGSTYPLYEPHYKIPTENSKTVVPDSQIAEFLNYDVPTRATSDVNEYNVIDDSPSAPHYDTVKSDPVHVTVPQNPPEQRSLSPEDPPELPMTPPPGDKAKQDKSTSEHIAALIGITPPRPQSSFLHNNNTNKPKEEQYKQSSSDYESATIKPEEATTTTNPIYTPTEFATSNNPDDIAEPVDKTPMDKKCKVKPRIPVKPCNIGNKSNGTPSSAKAINDESSAITDNVYDAVEHPNSSEATVSELQKDSDENFPVTDVENQIECPNEKLSEVSRQRNGSNKRQAPLPPKTSTSEVTPVPLPPKKSQRNSMPFANLGPTPNRPQTKSKSNSLGNFHRIKLHCSHHKDDKESKSKKVKFWKMILNKFGKEEDSCCHNKNNAPEETKIKVIKSSSLEITTPKKVKLEIIHPIDFEHSGGPQIIESPAITTTEDGLPSVIDCSSPASSICSGMDDNATSSDSGGNYESVGEDEDSSTGHSNYGSHVSIIFIT